MNVRVQEKGWSACHICIIKDNMTALAELLASPRVDLSLEDSMGPAPLLACPLRLWWALCCADRASGAARLDRHPSRHAREQHQVPAPGRWGVQGFARAVLESDACVVPEVVWC